MDKLLCDLGGERIHEIAMGDEMCGQDQAFRKWASGVFNVSTFDRKHNGTNVERVSTSGQGDQFINTGRN